MQYISGIFKKLSVKNVHVKQPEDKLYRYIVENAASGKKGYFSYSNPKCNVHFRQVNN